MLQSVFLTLLQLSSSRAYHFNNLPTFVHLPSSKALHYQLLLTYSTPSYHLYSFLTLTSRHPRYSLTDQAVFEANVVDTCTNLELVLRKDKNYRACVSIGTDYFVKYGHPKTLGPEFETQSCIFEYAKRLTCVRPK
ncbi:hypothetical protein PISMIDRAFT_159644 [Pisolithus microcarpus 441]|uniref:Protein transport protein SEC23 n=1 Tax=Pisolithus microcarpus 441 TaxID=765257 RepID=A0A0C9YYX4_9AGAM|nr:hypothetical protein PISMIDRAFT_159644 [Pisolithus microcarpus 441]